MTRLSLVVGLGLAAAVWAQGPVAFEVATIKPDALDQQAVMSGRAGTRIDSARVEMRATPLFRLICAAYGIKPYQLAGPDWLRTTTFTVQAKIPAGVTTDKVPTMLQALLAERFGLKMHHESREQAVLALVQAKGGAKLKESPAVAAPEAANGSAPPMQQMAFPTLQGDVLMSRGPAGILLEMPGGEISGKIRVSVIEGANPKRLHLESSNMSMKTLAELLSTGAVEKVVVDQTGLAGKYEVAVDISEFDAMGIVRQSITFTSMEGGGSDPSGSALRASISNLGLSLEPKKLPIDMVVIDHVERTPTEN